MKMSFNLLTALLFLQLVFVPIQVNAIGVSPPMADFPSVLNGVPQTKSVTLLRGVGDVGELNFTTELTGEYKHHFSVPDRVIIPADKDRILTDITINTTNAVSGDYITQLTYLLAPPESDNSSGSSMSVQQGIAINMHYTVSSEEVVDVNIIYITGSDSEVGSELVFEYRLENNGNTEWKPKNITIKITDKYDPTNVLNLTVPGDSLAVMKPGSTEQANFSVTADLIESVYTAEITFFNKDEALPSVTTNEFEIFPKNTFAQTGEFTSLTTNKSQYVVGEKMKVEGQFNNTGAIALNTVMSSEIYIDNNLTDIIRSDDLAILTKQNGSLNHIVDLKVPGQYKVISHIEYGNSKSLTRSVDILVTDNKTTVSFINILLWIAVVVTMIFCVTIIGLISKRRKENAMNRLLNSPNAEKSVDSSAYQKVPSNKPKGDDTSSNPQDMS